MGLKKFYIFIVVSMLILALLSLSACGNSSIGGSNEDGENVSISSLEDGKNVGISSGKDGEKVSISGGVTLVNNTIEAAKNSNGILISYAFSFKEDGIAQTSTASFGVDGEKYYFLSDVGKEYIYDISGSTGMDMYSKAKSDTLWAKTSTPYTETSKHDLQEIIDATYMSFVNYMTSYSIYSADGAVFLKSGTEKILGHTCTKYKYTVSLYDVSMTTIYCVEESSGICFKVGYEGDADYADAAVSMVLTEYQNTYTVNIPTEEQIVIEED